MACTAHASLLCKPLSAPPQKNLTRPTRLEMARNWTIVHFSLFSQTIIETMKNVKTPFWLSAITPAGFSSFLQSGHAWSRPVNQSIVSRLLRRDNFLQLDSCLLWLKKSKWLHYSSATCWSFFLGRWSRSTPCQALCDALVRHLYNPRNSTICPVLVRT